MAKRKASSAFKKKSAPKKPRCYDSASPLSHGSWSLMGFVIAVSSLQDEVRSRTMAPDCSSRNGNDLRSEGRITAGSVGILDETTNDGFTDEGGGTSDGNPLECRLDSTGTESLVANDGNLMVELRTDDGRPVLGGVCTLGSQGEIIVNGTMILQPQAQPSLEPMDTDADSTPTPASLSMVTYDDSSSSKKRRVATSVSVPSVTVQLHKLASRNGLHVEGRVVKVVSNGNETRVAVLFDVHAPSSKLQSWKSGPTGAFVFGHLSCDWELRKSVLTSVSEAKLWSPLSECRALGCELHPASRASFDLQQIFKGLSARDPRAGCPSSGIVSTGVSNGISSVPDEVLMIIFSRLLPKDLLSVSAICRHMRMLARSIVPCMKLRLFPHQQAALQWMLHRETHPTEFFNPLFKCLKSEDGLHLYLNCITGELSLEEPPRVPEFRGGLFCDEPGLGKTITALSLILKTQGLFAAPPKDAEVCWCEGPNDEKLGYYEVRSASAKKRLCADGSSPSSSRTPSRTWPSGEASSSRTGPESSSRGSTLDADGTIARNLEGEFENAAVDVDGDELSWGALAEDLVWVQCDACSKWRMLVQGSKPPRDGTAWFCRMNTNPKYQSCTAAEEEWNSNERVNSLEGFHKTNTEPGLPQNVAFFRSVLRERADLLTIVTRNALNWLGGLTAVHLAKIATLGLAVPQHLRLASVNGTTEHNHEVIFQAFGLVSRVDKGRVRRWYYPRKLRGFEFDTAALRTALATPVEPTNRVYLSKATLVVVPANLIDHWTSQIARHTQGHQLRCCVCVEARSIPPPHVLAWDNDIVITTFSRLSVEWTAKNRSPFMQVHWFRVILDEGHTLGASLALTNKLQMAINMHAARRWVLTGTPTPDTPTSQLVHLQPMLRFLHEELYGNQYKVWDAGILRPFEAQAEEGRVRLLQLLRRCMVCARKADLGTIPPCIRKVKLLEFAEKHAASYNLLVETVRRNILMADWNDPDHLESLLNPRQWKMKNRTLSNVRLACCVAGQMRLENSAKEIQETMDMVLDAGVETQSELYKFIRDALYFGANCFRCGEWCRLPWLTPCNHFLCLPCVSLDGERCSIPSCGRAFKMQKPSARPENPNPKWPVPQDLIELQPSYVQHEWEPNWQATTSSKVAYLIEELKKVEKANKQRQGTNEPPEKVIVFSQFLVHISHIEEQFKTRGIQFTALYSPLHAANKAKSLKKFLHEDDCLVLLMDGSYALGLDLSFVNRVYLMEPIWDCSMEEQVVSRAHRMGAKRPVIVETLAMRGTIEQQMLEFLQKTSSSSSTNPVRTHHDPAESWYLAHLAFARKGGVSS